VASRNFDTSNQSKYISKAGVENKNKRQNPMEFGGCRCASYTSRILKVKPCVNDKAKMWGSSLLEQPDFPSVI
jgi:hypothetical protein